MNRERQVAYLQVIDELTKEKGYPPTIREIGDRVQLRSSSAPHRALRSLRAEGLVTWEEGSPRTLRIVRWP